eukprot:jgi/Hompol1/3067/HPOL_006315-RA
MMVDASAEGQQGVVQSQLRPRLRLFAAGLGGRILEYDVSSHEPRHSVDSCGGAVWSLAVNAAQTRLAVGCEDGFVRLFRIPPSYHSDQSSTGRSSASPPIEFVAALERQPARIMALAWLPSGDYLVAGSSKGTVAKIHVPSSRSQHVMTLDTVRGDPTIVWDVKIL